MSTSTFQINGHQLTYNDSAVAVMFLRTDGGFPIIGVGRSEYRAAMHALRHLTPAEGRAVEHYMGCMQTPFSTVDAA